MKLFDLIKTELIGKHTYTSGNIKFKVEAVFQHYDELKNHFNTKEDIKLTALLLVGKDDDGNKQEVVLANNRMLDLFYCA
jgi:hypothetical protein